MLWRTLNNLSNFFRAVVLWKYFPDIWNAGALCVQYLCPLGRSRLEIAETGEFGLSKFDAHPFRSSLDGRKAGTFPYAVPFRPGGGWFMTKKEPMAAVVSWTTVTAR